MQGLYKIPRKEVAGWVSFRITSFWGLRFEVMAASARPVDRASTAGQSVVMAPLVMLELWQGHIWGEWLLHLWTTRKLCATKAWQQNSLQMYKEMITEW